MTHSKGQNNVTLYVRETVGLPFYCTVRSQILFTAALDSRTTIFNNENNNNDDDDDNEQTRNKMFINTLVCILSKRRQYIQVVSIVVKLSSFTVEDSVG